MPWIFRISLIFWMREKQQPYGRHLWNMFNTMIIWTILNIHKTLTILNTLNISNIFDILKKKEKQSHGHFGDDDASPAEVDEQNYRDKKLKKRQSQKLGRKRTTVKTVPAEEKLMSRTIKRRVGELSLVHFRQTIPNRLITCVWLVPIFGVPWIVWRCNFLNIVESKCQCWILIRSPLFSALHWYFYSYFGVILWQFLGLTLMSPWLMW